MCKNRGTAYVTYPTYKLISTCNYAPITIFTNCSNFFGIQITTGITSFARSHCIVYHSSTFQNIKYFNSKHEKIQLIDIMIQYP